MSTGFKRWLRLGFTGFWGRRGEFYKLVARSLSKKELLRDFVEGEYAIAVAPKTYSRSFAAGLSYAKEVMNSGVSSLADVLVAIMPAEDHMALSVLATAKDQIVALEHLSQMVEEQKALKKVVLGALFTPAFLVPVMFAFAYVITSTTIPAFVETAPPEIWTGFNLFFRTSAELFAAYGPFLFFGGVLLMIWIVVWALPNFTGGWRYKAEQAMGWRRIAWNIVFPARPLFGIYRDIYGVKMLSDLAFMLQSGRLIKDAIETLGLKAQPWMRGHLAKILAYLQVNPGGYVGAFSQGILSLYLAGYMMSLDRVDSENRFDKVLIEIGTVGIREAREAVQKVAFRLNFGLLISIMAVILYFYGGQMFIVKEIQDANSPAAVMRRAIAKKKAGMVKEKAEIVNSVESSTTTTTNQENTK